MHGAIALLMVLILQVIEKFVAMMNSAVTEGGQEALGTMAPYVPSFSSPQIQFLHYVTIGMIILLALINSAAIVATDGGHFLKVTFYLALLLVLSGVSMIVVPPMVDLVL